MTDELELRQPCPGCALGVGQCECDEETDGEAPTPGLEAELVAENTNDAPEAEEGLLVEETRAVDLTPPDYMRDAAAKGLDLLEFAGDGLVDRTVREARAMAAGEVTADKWVRIAAWLARHRTDLEGAPEPGADGQWTAGQVAHLLWGAEPTLEGNERTRAYAEGVVTQLEAEASERKDEEYTMAIEFRNVSAEFAQDGDGYTYRGHIALFDSPSSPSLGFTEVIKRGAFSKSISAATRGEWEVKAFQDHKPELFLGSTKTGSVSLVEDERGLLAEVRLNPDVTYASDLAATMKRDGAAMAASFGFTVPSKGDKWSQDGTYRELTNIRLHEVSILTGNAPAYPATVGLGAVRALATRLEAEPAQVRDAVDALLNGELDTDRAAFIRAALGKIAPEAIAAPADEITVTTEEIAAAEAELPASIRELRLRLMAVANPSR